MISRTVPPRSGVPPGLTSWATFSFLIVLLVELQTVGNLIKHMPVRVKLAGQRP